MKEEMWDVDMWRADKMHQLSRRYKQYCTSNTDNLKRSLFGLLDSELDAILSNLCMLEQTPNLLSCYASTILSRDMSIQKAMQSTLTSTNQEILQLCITYYKLLKREIELAHVKLSQESLICESLKVHSIFKRDMRLFSRRLELESSGEITLEFLETYSTQYNRCVKAFKENFSVNNNSNTNRGNQASNFDVLSVLKLQHSHLSNLLQVDLECDCV